MAKHKNYLPAQSNGAQRAINSYLDELEGKGSWHTDGEIAYRHLTDAYVPAPGMSYTDIPREARNKSRYEGCQ